MASVNSRLALVIVVLTAGSVFFPGLINLHDNPAWIVVLALVGASLAGMAAHLGHKKKLDRPSLHAL